jgi:DNA-binding response OmpR family regulator
LSPLSGKRILVVEDEALVAAMLEDMLDELGATVLGPAATIARGMSMARHEAIDAAVLDINVRGERIDAIAAALRERSIPILFTTGYREGSSSLTLGARVLEKPYKLEDLKRALATLLRLDLS